MKKGGLKFAPGRELAEILAGVLRPMGVPRAD
jgi:hypothetical protein